MALVKSEALVLRVIPFRDTSRILTAYTAEHGLVSLLAKGVRGPKPRFGAALELFALADLVYYHRDSRELQLLSEAMLLDAHLGLGRDPERYAYGIAVLEFLLKVLSGQEPPGRLYPLALRTLAVLETGRPETLCPVFRAFELKAISFLGHRPELYRCVECGDERERLTGFRFAPLAGGLLCPRCAMGAPGLLPVAGSTVELLRHLLGAKLDEIERNPPGADAVQEAGRILEQFLRAQLERYDSLRALRMAAVLLERRSGRAHAKKRSTGT
jgi:DNA repair protein RecO (recombination protein O)